MFYSIQDDLSIMWRLIRIINTREIINFASACLGIHPFDIALFADFQWSINENFDKVVLAHHVADIVTRGTIWTDGCTNDHATMPDDFGRDKANAPNVDVTVFLAESQTLGKMGSHHVAIQHRHSAATLQQQTR